MGFDSCEFVYKWTPDVNNPNKGEPKYVDIGIGINSHQVRDESSNTVDYNEVNFDDEAGQQMSSK